MKQRPVSGDSTFLKTLNKSTLLNLIQRQAPLSRADLAKKTRLTRATVSALVEELIAEHWVLETGIGESSGGRRPMMLELNSNAGCVIGLDLRMTNILLIITDMQGKILRKSVIPYDAQPGIGRSSSSPYKLLQQIVAIVEQEKGGLPETPLGLVGTGIGVHGFVEYPSGRIVFMPHTGWKGLSWKEELETRLGLPVILDNEANLAALGEHEFGAGADSNAGDMLYLSISGGIGAGFISGGELFRGSGGLAGEVGHTTIEANGLPCPCGNRGCWERYASERAVADKLALEYAPGITERLLGRLREKDPEVLSAIREAGEYLGIGIGNMLHTLNPQMIVVGNAMSEYSSWMNECVQEVLESRFSYVRSFQAQVRYSRLGEDSCALGAASSIIRSAMQKR
ncbi:MULTISPECIES: ROK family transcriptional regulator [unclassified Paenibacillus]|uniref:ROK family transcriptional regulator n=1 Tax=unclassified Paenibacillus TaxID=185978 RepID=UPI001AE48349|nr:MULTISPECIES: ROK family transcriptional regulator [unclassified Paenibacillus]MBP1154769.1 putative NBD/HSP70 family sugar kinase [Paenibacillus sp. PvP091]MBP1169847.1 putative NBD/HSP70 family sugar kinase [Paenibacillus sp. PvR098]MBP2440875.1 putative NBD/HSP70 family sugar kinase [Paenibacillus sp. PvP052]